MVATRVSLEVRPVDQMRSTYRHQQDNLTVIDEAHSLFRQRMSFQNFNGQALTKLIGLLERSLNIRPHNSQLKYELAWTLVQNCADSAALEKAHSLIIDVLKATSNPTLPMDDQLPTSLIPNAKRLNNLLKKVTSDEWAFAEPRVPQRANWAVHNRCPMVCMGCYNCFTPETLTIEQAKLSLRKLAKAGVESLIVSGGDPILWPDLLEYLACGWESGLSLGIDTTGYAFTDDLLHSVGKFVQYIGLPLDGSTRDIQNAFRRGPKDILDKTLHNLDRCDEFGTNVKINTTVTQYNIDDLLEIGRIVESHSCISNWSVFQWSPLRSTEKLRKEFAVPDTLYEARIAELRSNFPHLRIRTRSVENRELTHFFIQSDGQVVTFGSQAGEEFILGSILTDEIETMIRRPMFNRRSSKHAPTTRFKVGTSKHNDNTRKVTARHQGLVAAQCWN